MPKYTSNRIDLNVGFNVDKSGLDKVKQAFRQIQNIKPGQFQGTEAQLRKIQTQAKQVQKALSTAFNAKIGTVNLQTFQAELKKSETSINQVYASLSRLGGVGQAAFAKMSSSILSTNLQLKETHGLLQSFGNTMLNTIKWGFASSIINGFTSSIQQAISYVEGLDKSLTNIRIVTGDSREEMSKFAEEANRAAQSLGRSTMDYTKAALSYYQQGLSDEQVAARTEATLKAQNITGAGQEMADYLTAVWNGYKVVNDEAELYVDKMAAVADSSASNMAQLATAMSKVASTANMMGVDMDQLNAQIATIVATTRQAPESVGNALKTIYTRINDIKTGSDDAQISLGNYTSKMAQLGVNVLDASGNLRDTGEVIEQIGGKWDTMSREQQIYLSRTMAGQRQINNLLALFDNWSRYSDLVNISMQSQGTTMQKNSRYMESLGAHLNQLNAAQQRFKSSMIDSDSFKKLVDVGTGFTKLGAELIEAIGGGGTALLALGSIAAKVFSGIISKEIASSVINVQTFKNNLDKIAEAEKRVQEASAGALNQGLSKQYLADLRAMTSAWRGLSSQQKMAQQGRVQQLRDLRAEKSILQDNLRQASLLSQALTGKNLKTVNKSVLESQLQKFNQSIQNSKIAFQNFLDTVAKTGSVKGAKEQLKNLGEAVSSMSEKMKATAPTAIKQAINEFEKLQQKSKLTEEELEKFYNLYDTIFNYSKSSANFLGNFEQIQNQAKSAKDRIKQLGNEFKSINEQGIQINKIQSFVKIGSAIGQLTAGISGVVNAFKALKNESLSTGQKVLQFLSGFGMSIGMVVSGFRSLAPLMATAIVNLGAVTSLRSADTAAIFVETAANQGLLAAIKAQNAQYKEQVVLLTLIKLLRSPVFWGITAAVIATTIAVKKLHDAWTEDARAAQQAAQNAAAASQAYDQVKQSADDLKSSLEEYNSFQDTLASLTRGTEEWNQTIRQSNDLVLDLINKFPELAQNVKNVNGQLILDDDAIQQAQANMARQVESAQLNKIYSQAVSRQADIQSMATDLGRSSREVTSDSISWLNSESVQKIAQILNDYQGGLIDDVIPEDLIKTIKEETGASESVIQALLDNKDGLKELQNAMLEAENATRLEYEALAANSEELQNNSTYLGATEDQKDLIEAMTGAGLQQFTKAQADTWQTTLRTISNIQDARNQDWSQQVLKAVSDSLGKQLRWDTNSIRGVGDKREFVFQDEEGNEIKRRYDEVASMVAASQALEKLSGSATSAADALNKIENHSFDVDNEDLNQSMKAAIQEYIANQNFDNVSKGTLQQLKDVDITKDFGFTDNQLKAIAEANDTTVEQLQKDFQDLAQSTIDSFGKAFDQLPDALAEKARGVFKDADLTTGAEKAIVQNLHNAIAEGGKQGYEDLLYSYSKISDIQAFEDLASQLNFSTISAGQFGDKLEEAGVETNLTNKQLQKYIELKREQGSLEAAQTTYKDVHAITDELQTGDIIAPEDVEVLKNAGINLDKFFITTAQGGLKLVSSANQFKNAVNEITLENFRTEIAKTRELIANANTFREEHSFEDLSTYSRKQADVGDKLEFLSYTDVDPEQIANWQLLNEQQNLTNKQYRQINDLVKENQIVYENWEETISGTVEKQRQQEEALASTAQTISQLNDMLAQGDIDENVYSSMLKQASDTQMSNLGFDVDEYEDYVAILQATNEEAEKNEAIARQMAKTQMRVSQGMEQLIDNWQDWNDVLLDFQQTGDLSNLAENWGDISQGLANLFDTDVQAIDMLGPEFVANNLSKIQDVKNGVQGAYQQLSNLMSETLILNAYGVADFSQLNQDIQDAYNTIQDISNDDIKFEIGAVINEQEILDAFQRIADGANWTSAQAQAAFAQMGYDVEVTGTDSKTETATEENQYYIPPVYKQMTTPYTLGPFGPDGVATWLSIATPGHYQTAPGGTKQTYEPGHYAIKTVTKNGKSSGGKISRRKANASAPRKSSGSGGKGGSGSAPKAATQAKLNTSKIETKNKTAQTNPYQQQQKAFQRQEKILDNLQNKQKKLVNKDRLKNLKDQNKTLEQQIKILNKELDISRNAATKNSTANYAKRLKDAFGSVLKFDSDGQISDINALERASVNTYNAAAKAANDAFEKQKAKYNDYLTNTFNKYTTQQQQEAHKAEKERWDQRVKNAEEAAKKAISAAQEEYKTREDLIKSYNDAWEADQKRLEQIRDLQDQFFENQIAISKITVDLSLDTGEAEREWLEFEKKFIKKIDDDDFLGQAKASVKELMSYFNSKQIQQTANQMRQLQKEIAIMQSGALSSIYGDNLNAAKERLEELMKQQMGDLQEIQDLVNDIKDNYLDAIDDAKDKMDQQINQYERINDLIDHNVKLTELIYGDKAYETLDKYYNLMQKNNQQELDSLKRQQEYWQERMNQQVIGSDAWQQFKKNLDDTTDSLNDKLEEMIDNLSKKWQNKVDGIIEKLNNGLTGGRGLDYLDEQWDYINNYDDNFLDTVNSVMGTREVERLYKQASDDLSQNPKQQQKINKLMKQQLKILKEKNKLTEYDIERAKTLLQVEQARIALEDARNSKTKMRLRRDSQGNYTYQYVADEQKLSDLQDSLAKAQNDLYNMDKQHYKQNLNDITDTWKDFLEQYVRLSQEAQNTLDEQERARIIARRDLLLEETNKLMEGLTEDNKYTLGYLNQSFFDNMQINPSQYSAEEQMEIMNQNIPQMKSNIQDLANQIVGEGGILNATADAMKEINKTTQQYDANVENTLEKAGASLQNISQVVDATGNALDKNIQNAEKFITANEKLIANCHSQIEEIRTLMDLLNNYLDNAMSVESLISNLRNAYNIDQMLNKSKLTADVNIPVEDFNIDTTFSTLDQYQKYLSNMTQKEKQLSSTEIGNIWAEIQNKINSAEQGKTDLETSDLQSMFKAVQMVRNMTNALSGFSANQLETLGRNSINSLAGINTNSTLDQNVHIDASFPNVREHTEIEQAFENLVNMASMHASGYKD